jgi:hypothetical protein
VALILGLSTHADFQPVMVDPAFADELLEKELVEQTASHRKDMTGIDHTVFICAKGHTRYSPRLKLAIDPPDTVDPRSKTASIAIKDAAIVAGEDVPAPLLDQVRRFIGLNRGALLDYWEYRIDTEQLRRRLKPVWSPVESTGRPLRGGPSTAFIVVPQPGAITSGNDPKNCVAPTDILFILVSIGLTAPV